MYFAYPTMSLIMICLAGLVVCPLAIFVVLPLTLAVIATIRSSGGNRDKYRSTLYVGKVWHARYLPKVHSFSYPIFIFSLDLEEVDTLFRMLLWPLNYIVTFRESDHLINGEGMVMDSKCSKEENSLIQRILRVVSEKTHNKFQPTLKTHRVFLVTHLCYYGYNFNPVSFYYIINRQKPNMIDALVAEVSNTPWNEMHCYVLHPDSTDQVQTPDNKNSTVPCKHYLFPKAFHVSPFMEMGYVYDWTFYGVPGTLERQPLTMVTTMKNGDQAHFTAKLQIAPQVPTPFRLAWEIIRFPIFCMIIQIWIHYEAVWLFVKGIAYVPHPQGSETMASRTIAAIMTPFFAIRDWISPKSKQA